MCFIRNVLNFFHGSWPLKVKVKLFFVRVGDTLCNTIHSKKYIFLSLGPKIWHSIFNLSILCVSVYSFCAIGTSLRTSKDFYLLAVPRCLLQSSVEHDLYNIIKITGKWWTCIPKNSTTINSLETKNEQYSFLTWITCKSLFWIWTSRCRLCKNTNFPYIFLVLKKKFPGCLYESWTKQSQVTFSGTVLTVSGTLYSVPRGWSHFLFILEPLLPSFKKTCSPLSQNQKSYNVFQLSCCHRILKQSKPINNNYNNNLLNLYYALSRSSLFKGAFQ